MQEKNALKEAAHFIHGGGVMTDKCEYAGINSNTVIISFLSELGS